MAEQRGRPPRAPAPTGADQREILSRHLRLRQQEGVERVRMFRGLVMLAVLVLLLSMVHAGWDRVFVPGWWRQW